jgi:hypothetical protein
MSQQILKVVGVPASAIMVVPLSSPASFFSQAMDEILGLLLNSIPQLVKICKSFLLLYMLLNPNLLNLLQLWCITSVLQRGFSLHALNNSFLQPSLFIVGDAGRWGMTKALLQTIGIWQQ